MRTCVFVLAYLQALQQLPGVVAVHPGAQLPKLQLYHEDDAFRHQQLVCSMQAQDVETKAPTILVLSGPLLSPRGHVQPEQINYLKDLVTQISTDCHCQSEHGPSR